MFAGDVRAIITNNGNTPITSRNDLSSAVCNGENIDEFITTDDDEYPLKMEITNYADGSSRLFWQNGGRSGTQDFTGAFSTHSPLYLTVVTDPQGSGDEVYFDSVTISKQCGESGHGALASLLKLLWIQAAMAWRDAPLRSRILGMASVTISRYVLVDIPRIPDFQ